MNKLSEEEIIKILKDTISLFNNDTHCFTHSDNERVEAIKGLLDLYNKEKEKNKKLNNLIYTKLKLNIIENGICQIDYISKDKIKEKIKYYEELIKTNSEDEEILRHIIQALNELLEE